MVGKRAGVVASVTMLVLGVSLGRAQVVEQVPSDALFIVKVKNLQGTSDKVKKLAEELGLAAMAPEQMTDPLGTVLAQAQVTEGIDRNGELAFVYLDPAIAGGDEEKSMLFLVPVTDFNAFLGNFPEKTEQGGITEVKMQASGEAGFVAQWGKYAAMSPSKEALAHNATKGLKLSPAASAELNTKDLALWANFPELKGKLQPQLEEGRKELLEEVTRELENDEKGKQYVGVAKSVVNQLVNVADSFLRDSSGAVVSVNLSDAGVNYAIVADFQSGSYLGNWVSGLQNSDKPLMTGLGAGKFLIFGGAAIDSSSTSKLIDDLAGPILTELQAAGPEAKPILEYVDALKSFSRSTKFSSFAMLAPSGPLGESSLMQMVAITGGDAAAMQKSMGSIYQTQQDLMKVLDADAMGMSFAAKRTENAKTIDGVAFDMYKAELPSGDEPEAQQALQMMKLMFGPEGSVSYIGKVNDSTLLTVSGLSDEQIASAVAAARSGATALNDMATVKAVAAQLPKSRLAELYIPIDQLAMTVADYSRQMGFPFPVQLPPDLPPVGLTVGSEGTALRIEAHVPTQLVQSLVAAGMQAFMQMQGGQRGGPGGL
jgi:hypothetical protein